MNTTPSSPLHSISTTASDVPPSAQDQPQVDATTRVRAAGKRALVLGGGGSTGNAWLIGVIAGLLEAGLDVTEADLIIGTSAGSTAAAQITGAAPAELLAAILSAAPQPQTAPVASGGGRVRIGTAANHMERTGRIIAAAEDAGDMRRRMGAAALEMAAATDGSVQTRWRDTVATRLPGRHWRNRRYSSLRSMPAPVNRSCSTATAGSTWWTPWQRAVPVASPTVSAATDISTAATDPTPRMPIWQPDTHGCWCCHHSAADQGLRWTGACISQHRSPNYAHAGAGSKRSSRTAPPSTCLAPTRWICRCVRPPLEPVATKAEPLPSSSPNSGADAGETSRHGGGSGAGPEPGNPVSQVMEKA